MMEIPIDEAVIAGFPLSLDGDAHTGTRVGLRPEPPVTECKADADFFNICIPMTEAALEHRRPCDGCEATAYAIASMVAGAILVALAYSMDKEMFQFPPGMQ